MSSSASPLVASAGPRRGVKLAITLVLLFHFAALLSCVLAGGQPFVMKQLCAFFRPYLRFMWLDNAYRFYAPEPGPTDVLWYYLKYGDGSALWYQVPRREDFYLRMPFQRYMSIALLASSMTDQEEVSLNENPTAAAQALVENRPSYKHVLDPRGLIHFQSYARHIARHHTENPHTGAPLVSMDVYKAVYRVRTPYEIRQNYDMYDPRMITLLSFGSFDTAGNLIDEKGTVLTYKDQRGFALRMMDDLFVELVQNDVVPLLEENARLPAARRKSIVQLLTDYGIPYPLIQPILKLPSQDQDKFFAKPYDRETLRERYARAVTRDDVLSFKPERDPLKEQQKQDAVPGKQKPETPRSVQ